MSLADDLKAAKALIDTPEKWGKGGGDDDDNNCAITACNHLGGVERPCAAYDALWDALPAEHQRHQYRMGDVFKFNDDPRTTHADVMALFDRAIAKATGEAS